MLAIFVYSKKIYIYIYIFYIQGLFHELSPTNTSFLHRKKHTSLPEIFLFGAKKSSKNLLPNGGKANAKSKNSPFSQIQEKYQDWSPQSLRFFGLSNDKGAFELITNFNKSKAIGKKLHRNHHLGVGFDQHFTTKGSDWLLEKEWCMTSWKTIGIFFHPMYSCYGPPWRCISY